MHGDEQPLLVELWQYQRSMCQCRNLRGLQSYKHLHPDAYKRIFGTRSSYACSITHLFCPKWLLPLTGAAQRSRGNVQLGKRLYG